TRLHRVDSRPASIVRNPPDRLASLGSATARLFGRYAWRILDHPAPRALDRTRGGSMTTIRQRAIAVAYSFAAFMAMAPEAFAHVQRGEAGGFLSGFQHPISGLDHVAAMVAVGLWGAQLGLPAMWVLPVAFPLVMAFGGFLGFVGVQLPGVEYGIA